MTSFGGSLLVKPNPIDFDKVLVEFKKLPETGNTAVIVTVAIVFMCYFIALVIFRKTDKQDARHVSMTIPIYLVIPVPSRSVPPRPVLSWSVLVCLLCFVLFSVFCNRGCFRHDHSFFRCHILIVCKNDLLGSHWQQVLLKKSLQWIIIMSAVVLNLGSKKNN